MPTRGNITGRSIFTQSASPALYRLAADYIEAHGWRRGEAFGDDGEAACIAGGIYRAGVKLGLTGGVSARPFLKFIQVPDFAALFEWNDAPERTAEEVVKTLRAFADHLEEQER